MKLDAEIDLTADVLVTYRRKISGRLHQIRFECGDKNEMLIIKEAWNTRSTIETIEAALPQPTKERRGDV